MALTYEVIASATVTASGGIPTVEFTNIPNTYRDILVRFSLKENGNSTAQSTSLMMNLNGNASNRVTVRVFIVSSANISMGTHTDGTLGSIAGNNMTSNTFSIGDVYIPHYASNINKSFMSDQATENNSVSNVFTTIIAGVRDNTATITSIGFTSENTSLNIAQFSSAILYGIKNTV